MAKTEEMWTSELQEGEKLLWTGGPADTGIVDPENKYSFFIGYAIAAVWIAASLVKIIPERPDFISIVIIELVPFFILILPVLNARSLKKTSYAITDKRVIVNLGGNDSYSMEYDELTPVDERANGTICVGEAVYCKPRKERSTLLYRGIQDEDKKCLGIVLYKTGDSENAMNALSRIHDSSIKASLNKADAAPAVSLNA